MSAVRELGAQEKAEVERCAIEAAELIASRLVHHPPYEYSGDSVRLVFEPNSQRSGPTAEQIERVKKSPAYSGVRSLIAAAYKQKGIDAASEVVPLLADFFQASGMIYRLRVSEIEQQWQSDNKKGRASLDKVPAVFPSLIWLWKVPTFTFGSRAEGANSMEAVSRADLLQCATDFYKTGVRAPWFEKMLLEALVCAEVYATIKHAKTNPSALLGRTGLGLQLLYTWAYKKSRGEDPKFTTLTLAGRSAFSLGKLVVLVAFTWWALRAYQKSDDLLHFLWLIAGGASVAAVVGRWVVQTIVSWARPQGQERAKLIRENHFWRALHELFEAQRAIVWPSMSVTVARDAVLRSWANAGGIDHIVVAYLDRALAAHEYLWPV